MSLNISGFSLFFMKKTAPFSWKKSHTLLNVRCWQGPAERGWGGVHNWVHTMKVYCILTQKLAEFYRWLYYYWFSIDYFPLISVIYNARQENFESTMKILIIFMVSVINIKQCGFFFCFLFFFSIKWFMHFTHKTSLKLNNKK